MNFFSFIRLQSSIVVLEAVLIAGLMFGTFSILMRVTELEVVGLWVLVNSVLGFSRIADFWSQGLSSFVGEARGRGDDQTAAGFVTTAVASGMIGYLVLAVIGAPLIWLFARQLFGPGHVETVRDILPLMTVTFWLMAVGGIYQLAFLGFGRPRLKAVQTVGGALLFLAGTILMAPQYGLMGILLAQLLQAVTMLVFAAIAFHGFIGGGRGNTLWQRDHFRTLATFGSKAMVVGGVTLSFEPVVRLLVSHFGGLAAVALVEVAARLIAMVRNLIISLGQLLVPAFASLGASVDENEVASLYRDVSRLFFLLSVLAFSLLLSASPALEELVLGRRETGLLTFLMLLSAGWFASTIAAPAYFLLVARRQLRPLFFAHLFIMLGAIGLGGFGGVIGGDVGVLFGVAIALMAGATYLNCAAVGGGVARYRYAALVRSYPSILLPIAAAIATFIIARAIGVAQSDLTLRLFGYASAVIITLLTCLRFGQIREIIQIFYRIRS